MKMNLHKINKLLVELKQKINEKNVGATISINVDTENWVVIAVLIVLSISLNS